jgi:NitT/TauT family transport system permease protein
MPKGSVGQMLYMSKIYLDTDDLLAWTVIIVVLSVIFEKLVVLTLKAALKK